MKNLSVLNKYFKKYKWHFILGVIFVLLTNYFRILYPQITGFIINTVIDTINNKHLMITKSLENRQYNFVLQHIFLFFSGISFFQTILYSGILLFILAFVSGFFMFLMRQTIIVMSRHIEFDQKNEIYQHYQTLDLSFYKSNSTGDLMNRISEDVSRVRMYTGPALMYFINLAAVIGFCIYFMLQSDVRLTLYALMPLPLLAITIYFVNAVINKKSENNQNILSTLTSISQETFSGIRVVKSFVQERDMIDFFKKNNESYRKNALSLAKTEAIYFPSMALMIGLSTLITIMVGGLDVANHMPGASVGKIAEFILYIQMMTFPVSAIGWTASMTQRAAASQKRINEFLDINSLIADDDNAKDFSVSGNISFDHVSFRYKNTGISAINNFSFKILKGQKIAIVGKTGSGKTTIAQLILRFYDIDSGVISIDNRNIKEFNLHALRSQISFVPQDNFLFSDTVANNISFGSLNATKNEIFQAAKNASIYDEIISLPEGFETTIGERGVTLSGGQKQRIAIARALIKNPEVLILDDCLSAVDAKTEKKILENLEQQFPEKTIIFITHRIFSAFTFDKIIVLNDGKIAEIGTHDELLSQKGLYMDMLIRQQNTENQEYN
jgi:ATP-binding cassette subfamily B protein